MKKLLTILAFFLTLAGYSQTVGINNNLVTIDASGNVSTNGYFSAGSRTFANRIIVGTKGNYTTLKAAITALSSSMPGPTEILIDGGNFAIADSIGIQLSYPIVIRGQSYGNTVFQAATGLTNKPMFNIRSEVYFYGVKIDGTTLASWGNNATENIINVTSAVYLDVQNCYFKGGYTQVNGTGNLTTFIFNNYLESPVRTGITVNATGATDIDVEINTFTNCPIGINLLKSNTGYFKIMTNVFQCRNSPSDTAWKYVPASYTYTDGPVFSQNKWNNLGVFVSGPDYTLTTGRDANIFDDFNIGRESKAPHAKINLVGYATPQSLTSGVWTKLTFTSTSIYTCKFTLATGRDTVIYQPVNKRDIMMWLSGTMQTSSQLANIKFCVVKNGNTAVRYGQIPITLDQNGRSFNFSTNVYIPDAAATESFAIYVQAVGANETITITDLNWLISAQ